MTIRSCMGGWCEYRDVCDRHVRVTTNTHERLCLHGDERPVPIPQLPERFMPKTATKTAKPTVAERAADEIFALLQDAPKGLQNREVRVLLPHLTKAVISDAFGVLKRAGKVVWVADHGEFNGGHRPARFFALKHAPKMVCVAELPNQARHRALRLAADAKVVKATGKVTVCPPVVDTRYAVTTEEASSFFSGCRPGQYPLQSGSASERAYGG